MQGELFVLRLVHVLGGAFWAGALVFMSYFLQPALAAAGPAAGPVMGGLERRKLFTIVPVVALLTILTGLRLLQRASHGFGAEYFTTAMGRAYVVALLLSVAAFLIGMFISRPAMLRAGQLLAQRESTAADARAALDAQVAALRTRGASAMRAVTWLVLAATAIMAVARYL